MFLGDMGKKDDPSQKAYIKSFVSKLNCAVKILILGNHDILSIGDWYDVGFNFVTDRIDTNKYIFTHFPVYEKGKINFHGHIHDEKEYWNQPVEGHINCYIGNHDNQIYTMKEYLKWYREGRYSKGMKSVKKEFK
jgi:calcineurin-like phosphoesterase family protein